MKLTFLAITLTKNQGLKNISFVRFPLWQSDHFQIVLWQIFVTESRYINTGTLNYEFLLIQKSSSICKHYWISFTSMTVELKYLSCEYTPLEFSLSSCSRETTLTRVKHKKRERKKDTFITIIINVSFIIIIIMM